MQVTSNLSDEELQLIVNRISNVFLIFLYLSLMFLLALMCMFLIYNVVLYVIKECKKHFKETEQETKQQKNTTTEEKSSLIRTKIETKEREEQV